MARKRPAIAPAEGLLTEAVLTMSALCRTAAHDPKQKSTCAGGPSSMPGRVKCHRDLAPSLIAAGSAHFYSVLHLLSVRENNCPIIRKDEIPIARPDKISLTKSAPVMS
jgi:hypothetical protein